MSGGDNFIRRLYGWLDINIVQNNKQFIISLSGKLRNNAVKKMHP
jgi:hypothetical protein